MPCAAPPRSSIRSPPDSRSARGFTLIELIAAFTLFAIGFGILLQILSSGLHTTTQAADYTRAALWAQSLLDVAGVGEPLREGDASGRFDDRYRWDLRVHKVAAASTPSLVPSNPPILGAMPQSSGVELFELELVVSWDGSYLTHHARFVTLRAQNADADRAAAGALPRAVRPVQPGAKP
jgi:general secretion pathway protein I